MPIAISGCPLGVDRIVSLGSVADLQRPGLEILIICTYLLSGLVYVHEVYTGTE